MGLLDNWGCKRVAKPAPERGKPRYVVVVLFYQRRPNGMFEVDEVDRVPHYTAATAIASCGAINQPLLGDPDEYYEAFIRKPKKGEFDAD